MDSNRVLMRNAAAAVIAVSVVGGAGSGAAASTERTATQATDQATTEAAEAAAEQADAMSARGITTVHNAVWRTSAKAVKRRVSAAAPAILNKAYAFRLVARRSWPGTQFQCLDSLWTRESGWNHRAENPSSGAYGIPQALPGNKMSGTGVDWRFNPVTQIRWGLKYIRLRYGSPCGAWGHFQSNNWY
ncbi:lytic transglycosylase domain-containing protein [Microtetraspora sp. AC03309]|uniref:lytic transglycosylase domain-containing protein n=1 Tax=Microtetraspora sp. AC03309 TaxID=2779376 RepID=UPI001E3A77A1|nr:lytic transglycosylase domain-containing protein [Microtetraspora sp. AC03309]